MTDSLTRPVELERLRRRTLRSLVAGVALGSTGHIAAATVATIVAQDIAGSTAWSGAPGATVVLGAAAGAVVLSQLMVRSGRRTGLAAGYGDRRRSAPSSPPRPWSGRRSRSCSSGRS